VDVLKSLLRDARFTTGIVMRKPFSVLLQVTNRCNMQCSFCDFWPNAAPKKDELTLDDYRRVAKELAETGCYAVSIEGGEPFVRPDLVEIVRAFGKHHVPMLFTNGWYVTRENARALWDAGLVHADVSIDYPDALRHDKKRGMIGATERAWRAVDHFRDTAPKGGKQVNVMTVIMDDNHADLAPLVEKSAAAGVGHHMTLISVSGYRRGKGVDKLPPASAADALLALYKKHPHVRYFESYFTTMKSFLDGATSDMPRCDAGHQGFNIDHIGNVAPCIERIGESVGNVKESSIKALLEKLKSKKDVVAGCQDCWTACRGFQQALGGGGSVAAFRDLATRMRVD
jgi:MoaA/NifB/PqqE/SkfB family radical SAM enzyme